MHSRISVCSVSLLWALAFIASASCASLPEPNVSASTAESAPLPIARPATVELEGGRLPPERVAERNGGFSLVDGVYREPPLRGYLTDVRFGANQLTGKVISGRTISNAAPASGLQMRLDVSYRAGESRDHSAFYRSPQLSSTATSNREGFITFDMSRQGRSGLPPGEYRLKISPVGEEVGRAKQGTASIFSAEEGETGFGETRHADQHVFTLLVGTSHHWIDEGTIGSVTIAEEATRRLRDARARVDGLLLDRANAERGAVRGFNQENLTAASAELDVESRALNSIGGVLTAEELLARQQARANRSLVQAQIADWEELLLLDYMVVLFGDLRYWYWYAVALHGNPIWRVLESGKLPWEDMEQPLKYGPNSVTVVKDMAGYREYLKERVQVSIEGLPDTWPERGYDGDPRSVNRGGHYHPSMLTRMIRDIDDFSFESFVEKKDGRWVLRDREWMVFESDFRKRLGVNGEDDPRAVRLAVYPFTDEDHSEFVKLRDPRSTAKRLRGFDTSRGDGLTPSRFPNALSSTTRALEALAALPSSYRYSIFRDLEGLNGEELDQRLGGKEAFPTTQRRTRSAVYRDYAQQSASAQSFLERTALWRDRYVLFYYKYGRGRNLERTQRVQRQMDDARYRIMQRGN